MSLARCLEPDCEWEAEAPNKRVGLAMLYRHFAESHNEVPF